MNKIPSILVNSGCVTDQNGNLTGIIIAENVTTLSSTIDVTTYATDITNMPFAPASILTFTGYKIQSLSLSYNLYNTTYSKLTSISYPDVTGITLSSSGHVIMQNTHITTINFPKLETITQNNQSIFCEDATGVTSFTLPKFKRFISNGQYGCFFRMTGLQSATLGSEGNPVASLPSNTFQNTTQSGLTITVYTADGLALSGSPWGATNATIVWEEA